MEGKLQFCHICGNHHSGLCSFEISYFTYYPESQNHIPKSVELVGEWYRWQNHEKMDRKIDMMGKVCFCVGSNVPIGKFQYKYIVQGKWTYSQADPKVPDPYGSYNNVIEVLPKKALVEYIPRQDTKITSSLALKDIKIVGSWDNWSRQIPMELAYNNLKGCQENYVFLQLIPNMNYQFKFKYNNTFLIDEKYPTVTNQFGSQNNRIFVCSQKINTPYRLNQSVSSSSFSCRSFEWEKVQVQGSLSEYKRTLHGHTMCQIGENIYIFGGLIHNDFTNRLTKVNIHKLGCMQAEQIQPNERAFHCAAVYGNKMIIFGGINKNILQDYHAFNTTDRTWVPAPEIKGNSPSKREKQTCVLYKTLLVFFGGYYCSSDIQFQSTYNEIQVLDIGQMRWINEQLIKVNGPLPQPRFSHASALIHSKMYIFGGKNVSNEKGFSCYVSFNDLWVMDLEDVSNLHWEQLKPKGNPPDPRHGHSMNALQQFLIIFGGQNDKRERFNDVIVFDTQKLEWIYPIIKYKTAMSQPLPRVYHGATTIDNESIVVFGGKNINEKNTSFYVLKPKDIHLDLDIEEEDQLSGTESEGNIKKQIIPRNDVERSYDRERGKQKERMIRISELEQEPQDPRLS